MKPIRRIADGLITMTDGTEMEVQIHGFYTTDPGNYTGKNEDRYPAEEEFNLVEMFNRETSEPIGFESLNEDEIDQVNEIFITEGYDPDE